jgi:hypothetical protein
LASLPMKSVAGDYALPAAPNLEHLKKQAKRRLRAMRQANVAATLAQAQLALARDYGFMSWRALKATVDSGLDRFTGHFRRDPNVMPDSVLTFTSHGGILFVQGVGAVRTPLEQGGPGIFMVKDTGDIHRFEGEPGRPATRLLIGEGFRTVEALRTNAAARKEAEAAFARELAAQSRPRTRVDLDPRILPRYVGVYACPVGHVIEVTLSGNRLFVSLNGQVPYAVEAERPDHFFFPAIAAQISFPMRDGRTDALLMHQYGRVLVSRRVSGKAARDFVAMIKQRCAEQQRSRKRVMLGEALLERYVGRYRLDQHATLSVTAEGDRLFGEFTRQGRFELFADAVASFFTEGEVRLTFMENETGQIDRAIVHQPAIDLAMMRESSEQPVGGSRLPHLDEHRNSNQKTMAAL